MANVSKNSWTTLNNKNIEPYIYSAYGVYKNRFIVLARKPNQDQHENQKQILMYDVQTQTHTFLSGRHLSQYYNGTVLDDVLYVFTSDSPIQRIGLSSLSKWEEVRTIFEPYPRAIISDKDSIYIFGFHSKICCYDPVKDRLKETLTMPKQVMEFAPAVVAGKIYIIGGWSIMGGFTSTVQVFDIVTQTWSEAPHLPAPVGNAAVTTVLDRWIIVSGGQSHQPDYKNYVLKSNIYVFDTVNQEWSTSDIRLTSSRVWHKSLTAKNQIVCIGGKDGSNNSCPIQAIKINEIIPNWRYEHIKHFILMRQLIDEGRATLIATNRIPNINKTEVCEERDKIIQKIFTEMNLDMFRNVISFL